MFVPVVDHNQRPWMPTTPARARRWIKTGKATVFWQGEIFCIRLNHEPSARERPPVAVGMDPASKREDYSIVSAAHTYLDMQAEARDGVKDAEETRQTPCRKPRQNRKPSAGKLPPSTRARWQEKVRLARFLCLLFPLSLCVGEDIAAPTKKGQRRWNASFSPLDVGKQRFCEQIKRLTLLRLVQSYETHALCEQWGLRKTGKKLAETFAAHCVAAFVLARNAVGGTTPPDNRRLVCVAPCIWPRRQLHRFQPEGMLSQGITRSTLIVHPRWSKATVGGTMDGRLSLHDPSTNRRLTQTAQVSDCTLLKLLRWRTRLIPLHPRPQKGGRSHPLDESQGFPNVEFL